MILNYFVDWASDNVSSSEDALKYLYSRGVSNDQILRYKIGYISEAYDPISELDVNHTELCNENLKQGCDTCRFKYFLAGNRLRESIVLPLTSYSKKIIGVQLRSIKEKRYESFMIQNRSESYFFGLSPSMDRIWSREEIAITEGPFDALALDKTGLFPVVALTTNTSNENQTRFLRRFVKKVYLFLDLDQAGRDGASKISNKLNDKDVQIVNYKHNSFSVKDLNELWSRCGDERFQHHIKSVLGMK